MAQDCTNIQIIEPTSDLPVDTTGATADPALTERGEETLVIGQSEVAVTFQVPKLTAGYRFEYLYVDAQGLINPGTINPVPIKQSTIGFTVDLAGTPPVNGYLLRWRVVVTTISAVAVVDAPESIRIQLPSGNTPTVSVMDVPFTNPRSGTDYGFSELRVENLIDDPSVQSPIVIQVYAKALDQFSVCWNPFAPTGNYYLVARTP